MARVIFNGSPGEVFTNDTGKVLFQLIVAFHNSCGVCISFARAIGPSWPTPFHRGCLCVQIPVLPGKDALPFVDFLEEIKALPPAQRAVAVGRTNWQLVSRGVVDFAEVVTPQRVRTLREVVSRNQLDVNTLLKAGVNRRTAEQAYQAVHTPAHELAAAHRQTLVDALAAKGLTKEQVKTAFGQRVAGRVGIASGPGGPGALPVVPTTPGPTTPETTTSKPSKPSKPKTPKSSKPVKPEPVGASGTGRAGVTAGVLKALGVKSESIAAVVPESPKSAGGKPGVVTAADLDDLRARLAGLSKPSEKNAAALEWLRRHQDTTPVELVRGGMPAPETFHRVEIGGVLYHYPPVPAEPGAVHPMVSTARGLAAVPPLPPELSPRPVEVFLSRAANKHDAHWADVYDTPGFKSGATGGLHGNKGEIVSYGGEPISVPTQVHEMGHIVALAKWGSPDPPAHGPFAAARASAEPPPSDYAKVHVREDWAESVMHYWRDPAGFRDQFPKRAAAVESALGVKLGGASGPDAPPPATPPKPATAPAPPPPPPPPPENWKPRKPSEFAELTSAAKAKEWGGANYKGWAESVTPDERTALRRYSGDNYQWINAALRGDTSALPHGVSKELARETAARIDDTLSRGKTDRDLVFWRGVRDARALGLDPAAVREGDTLTFQGLGSFSTRKDVAGTFAFRGESGARVVLKVLTPGGSTGAYLNAGGLSNYEHEHEFLAPHGSQYRFVKHGGTFKDEWGNTAPVLILERVR